MKAVGDRGPSPPIVSFEQAQAAAELFFRSMPAAAAGAVQGRLAATRSSVELLCAQLLCLALLCAGCQGGPALQPGTTLPMRVVLGIGFAFFIVALGSQFLPESKARKEREAEAVRQAKEERLQAQRRSQRPPPVGEAAPSEGSQ